MRKDKLKNKSEVAKALLKNPTLTEREVAKVAWVSPSTAHEHIKDFEQSQAEGKIMDRILSKDDEIIELVNSLTFDHIKAKVDNKEQLESVEVKILWDLANNSTKRKAIFGDSTKDKDIQFIIS